LDYCFLRFVFGCFWFCFRYDKEHGERCDAACYSVDDEEPKVTVRDGYDSADRWSDGYAEVDEYAKQTEAFGSFLFGQEIGDHGLLGWSAYVGE